MKRKENKWLSTCYEITRATLDLESWDAFEWFVVDSGEFSSGIDDNGGGGGTDDGIVIMTIF